MAIRVGVIGMGKMGISHFALLNAHPDVTVAGICDSSRYVLGVLGKNTETPIYSDIENMLERAGLDAVFVATPTATHAAMVDACLARGLHVFCEKPLTLSPEDSRRLARVARQGGLATQVGYHNRFVSTFGEVKTLLDTGAVGRVTHILGEAYGPVVLKPKGSTWRSRQEEGGGCLYDYAAHVVNLVNWYLGKPAEVRGAVLPSVFSRRSDDSVFATLNFSGGETGQLSVIWSDPSYRKMTTRVTVWGTKGKIFADRQEIQTYLSDSADLLPGYVRGWNVSYTTDLTPPVWYYLRGEEYSRQIEAFVNAIMGDTAESRLNDFESATETDETIAMVLADSAELASSRPPGGGKGRRTRVASWFGRSRTA